MKHDRRVGVTLLTTVVMALLAGCSDDGVADDASGSIGIATTDARAVQYALLTADGWEQRSAVRARTRPDALEQVEPSLDWWAEYNHDQPVTGGVEGQDLRLSGHHVALDDLATELVGFRSTDGTMNGRRALLGTGA